MRYAGEKMAQAELITQQAPVKYGRIRFQSESDARMILAASARLKSYALPGRVKRIGEISYVSAIALDFCYGWVSTKEDGVCLVFLPRELAFLWAQPEPRVIT